jgi:hypothetical protein
MNETVLIKHRKFPKGGKQWCLRIFLFQDRIFIIKLIYSEIKA